MSRLVSNGLIKRFGQALTGAMRNRGAVRLRGVARRYPGRLVDPSNMVTVIAAPPVAFCYRPRYNAPPNPKEAPMSEPITLEVFTDYV